MARQASIPRRTAVPTTDLTAAHRPGPQAERKPPVTLRYTTIGRRSRSLPLLCGFRGKAASDSKPSGPLIPTEGGHRFRAKPATLVAA